MGLTDQIVNVFRSDGKDVVVTGFDSTEDAEEFAEKLEDVDGVQSAALMG